MDDHFDIARVFEIGKFDITRLTCTLFIYFFLGGVGGYFWRYEDFVDIFGGSRQNRTSFRCLFYVF